MTKDNVPIVGKQSIQAETDNENTVTSHVNKRPTESDALRQHKSVTCAHCGAEFEPKTFWQRFCSGRCRVAAFRAKRV